MTTDALNQAVDGLLREVAARIIMPRFRTLTSDEIDEKSPGEVVTIADRESEMFLAEGLSALLPEAQIVGEEASDEQPELLTGLDRGVVWLIDPLDGTRNFANGSVHFSIMIGLVCDGETQASWIYHPTNDRMFAAQRGKGAVVDGERFSGRPSGSPNFVGALPGYYAAPKERQRLDALSAQLDGVLPGLLCAGADYPRCVDGTQDFALFWRSLPWDHAPGALFVEEAGGKAGWLDGKTYAVGDTRPGILAAATPLIWDRVAWLLTAAP